MNIKLIATGSQGDFYNVLMNDDNGKLTVRCSCPAAQKGWMCRHIICLFSLDVWEIEDMYLCDKKNSKTSVVQAKRMLHQTPLVTKRFQKLIAIVSELEDTFEDVVDIKKECTIHIKDEMCALVHPDHAHLKLTATDLDAIHDYLYLIQNKIAECRDTLDKILKKT
ncbi:hypothetical protein BXD50_003724 [Salmonella enterica subsp. enterica]|nr:hypothetical protein [Salmonella enterica subsp. enterica]EDN4787955.1 hypothetical protein [Salmonella enterica subsp. enterica]